MGKNVLDLRFVVDGTDEFRSSVWRLWITRSGDVYLSTRAMGGIKKYSFHQSGICRSAFTSEYSVSRAMINRVEFEWRRAKTPALGTCCSSRVAWIAFPTDYLSKIAMPKATTELVAAAPKGGATYIELAYTLEPEYFLTAAFQNNNKRLLSFTRLASGEGFYVASYHSDWENSDLKSPPGQGSIFPTIIFSASDPLNTGRPIRMQLGPQPKDGDALILQELGGYRSKNDD